MDWGFMLFGLASTFMLAGGGVLLIAGYLGLVPPAFASSLREGLIALLLPVIGPVWFGLKQGAEYRRPVWMLVAAMVLVTSAGGLIFGLGPKYAEKFVAEAIEAAKER